MPSTLSLTACEIDLDRLEVRRDGAVKRLSPTERDLLLYLSSRPGQVVSRQDLLVDVWGYAPGVRSRTPDTTIGRLRSKIEADASTPDHILTVRGGGWEWQGTAIASEPTGLPVVADTFVGREAELAELAEVCQPGVLVSVTGPPGCGRSRLVHELVRRDGGTVLWVDVTDADEPGKMLLEALSGAPGGAPDPGVVAEACPHGWVVVDGVSGASETLESVLEALRQHASKTRVVVTAPRRLGLSGESVFGVPPLNRDEARSLLEQRAKAAGAAPGAYRDADELLNVVDGHPLAIELAAGRVSVLGADRLADRVRKRLDVLQDRAEGISLQVSIAEAWASLEPWAQQALTRLAPTRAGFDLEAAEALLGELDDGPWGLDALDDLVRWSWVHAGVGPEGNPRFHLARVVALFAEQQTSSEALAEAREAHARHYGAVCLAAYEPDMRRIRPPEVPRLVAEVPNLASALTHGAMADPDARWGLLLGLSSLVQRTTTPSLEDWLVGSIDDETDPLREFEFQILRFEERWYAGRIDEGFALLESLKPPNLATEAVRSAMRGSALHLMRRGEEAQAAAERAYTLEGAPTDARLRGLLILDVYGHEDALSWAAELLRGRGWDHLEAMVIQQRAVKLIFAGRMAEARDMAERGVTLGRDSAHLYSHAGNLAIAAETSLALDLDADVAPLIESIELHARLGQAALCAHYTCTLARVELLRGNIVEGRRLAEEAVAIATRAKARGEVPHSRQVAAEAALLDNDRSGARVHLEQAMNFPVYDPVNSVFAAWVNGEAAPEVDPTKVFEGVHGRARLGVFTALANGEPVPEPEFPELVCVQIARRLAEL